MATSKQEALDYHYLGRPGKTEVVPTKPCLTARDLSLAYTPGVAVPCEAIAANADDAYKYTNRGNLVAVVSNGTAVLGLGDIGALAGKPVMEGKGVLFKRFGHVDVFDIELDTHNPDEVIQACRLLAPTFGGINLEDIKAPECFHIEEVLRQELDIPVFHDDQHGTAIIAGAALINAAHLQGKNVEDLKIVVSGAGAAALACSKFFELLGVKHESLLIVDSQGVCWKGRTEGMNKYKEYYAQETDHRTLADAVVGADVLMGCSVANIVTKDMVKSMADKPIVFAMSNPDPEITYEDATSVRSDLIMATGRSDYPNQVNNVLGFPFIFRGALDVRASAINEVMKLAAAHALAELAREPAPSTVSDAYGGEHFEFGPNYIIPKPFDTRVLSRVAPAVAKAACDTGVAREPITNWDDYRSHLEELTNRSLIVMHTIRSKAKAQPHRIVFTEGSSERILEACRVIVAENFAKPILLGNPDRIQSTADRLGISLAGMTIKNPRNCANGKELARQLFEQRARRGYDLRKAQRMSRRPIVHGTLMLGNGEADGMVCGAQHSYVDTLKIVLPLAELRQGVENVVGMNVVMARGKAFILADTTINFKPDSRMLVEIALMAATVARHFNLDPVVALLSFSTFGDNERPESLVVREAVSILKREHPELQVDGEMRGDTALNPLSWANYVPDSGVQGPANVLVFPDLQSANIAFMLLKSMCETDTIGPLLYGLRQPINMVSVDSTVDEIINMAALSSYEVGRA